MRFSACKGLAALLIVGAMVPCLFPAGASAADARTETVFGIPDDTRLLLNGPAENGYSYWFRKDGRIGYVGVKKADWDAAIDDLQTILRGVFTEKNPAKIVLASGILPCLESRQYEVDEIAPNQAPSDAQLREWAEHILERQSWYLLYEGHFGGCGNAYSYDSPGGPFHDPDDILEPVVHAVRRLKPFVVVDGKVQGDFSWVSFPRVSEDGAQVTFVGYRDGEELLVTNGKAVGTYDDILEGSLGIGPQNILTVLYARQKGDAIYSLIVNGQAIDRIRSPNPNNLIFSPDGRSLLYDSNHRAKVYKLPGAPAYKFGLRHWLRGIQGLSWYSSVGPIIASSRGGDYVVDPSEFQPYPECIKALKTTPNATVTSQERALDGSYAYCLAEKKTPVQRAVVYRGAVGSWHADVSDVNVCPRTGKMAYVMKEGRQSFVVVDGKKYGPYDGDRLYIYSPFWTDDCEHFSYKLKVGAKKDAPLVFVVDGVRQPAFDLTTFGVFSPDGHSFAYLAYQNKESFIVLNGAKGPSYEWVSVPVFTDDGREMIYTAGRGGAILLVRVAVK